MLTILHGSDLHFGKLHDPDAADAFLQLSRAVEPDLIVVSGDLTKRAKVAEYEAVVGFLARLPDAPLVLTLGNHDVPLYRVWERLFAPFGNYRQFIADKLDSTMQVEGAVVVALSSAAPRRAIVNGRIDEAQLDWAESAFSEARDADVRVLVLHHPLVFPPDSHGDRPLPRAAHILERLDEMRVELVLSGHLHRGFVATAPRPVSASGNGFRVRLVHTGTTTSQRGRVAEIGQNSCNVIRIGNERIEIIPYLRSFQGGAFQRTKGQAFSRGRVDKVGHDRLNTPMITESGDART